MAPSGQQESSRLPAPVESVGPVGRYWVRITLGLVALAVIAFPFLSLFVAVQREVPSLPR